jgi:uncharacterized caspase-like protein
LTKRIGNFLAPLALLFTCNACSVVTTYRPVVSNPATGLDVYVAAAQYGPHDHPVQVSEQIVSDALINSGYFIHTDVEPIAVPIATEIGRLKPNEEIYLQRSGADFFLYIKRGSIEILRFRHGIQTGTSKYAFTSPVSPSTRVPLVATSAEVGRTQQQKAKPAEQPNTPRIWTFAIGISAYQDRDISLAYANRDATGIDAFFASEQGGSVPKERRVLLTDERANRSSILSELTQLSRRAAPDDLLILYLAMHGLPDDGGELYFIAYDTDPNKLVGTGLPQRDIEYALVHSQAKCLIMMVDACHAGGAGLDKYARNRRGIRLAETNQLLAQLAQSKPGLAVFTASTATESSYEGRQWGEGHGVFTYYLLEGLRGNAKQSDGVVTIRSLFDFVYNNVSEATGGQQHPELKGVFDNGLPLAAHGTDQHDR